MLRPLLPLVLLLAACASAPRGVPVPMASPAPTAGELAGPYQPAGEIHVSVGRSAGVSNSYGRYRVVGPQTSISRNREGRWGGTLAGQTTLLDVEDGRIRGAGVELTVQRDGETIRISGLWRNARLDLSLQKDHVTGTPGGGCSIDLTPAEGTVWRGFLACPTPDVAVVRLEGAAQELPDVALPQWLFAFLGALPEGP